jgi:hypothetical protein
MLQLARAVAVALVVAGGVGMMPAAAGERG